MAEKFAKSYMVEAIYMDACMAHQVMIQNKLVSKHMKLINGFPNKRYKPS